MKNNRRQADAAAVAAGRIGRLEAALRSALHALKMDAPHRSEIEEIEAALADGATVVAPASTDWTECTRCGDAYVSDKEGCIYKDKTCPMKGTRP